MPGYRVEETFLPGFGNRWEKSTSDITMRLFLAALPFVVYIVLWLLDASVNDDAFVICLSAAIPCIKLPISCGSIALQRPRPMIIDDCRWNSTVAPCCLSRIIRPRFHNSKKSFTRPFEIKTAYSFSEAPGCICNPAFLSHFLRLVLHFRRFVNRAQHSKLHAIFISPIILSFESNAQSALPSTVSQSSSVFVSTFCFSYSHCWKPTRSADCIVFLLMFICDFSSTDLLLMWNFMFPKRCRSWRSNLDFPFLTTETISLISLKAHPTSPHVII
jgi:hypothetical protein